MVFPIFRTETGHQIAQLNCIQIVREGSHKVVVHIMLGNISWYKTEILRDITYLELVPIALSIFLWEY